MKVFAKKGLVSFCASEPLSSAGPLASPLLAQAPGSARSPSSPVLPLARPRPRVRAEFDTLSARHAYASFPPPPRPGPLPAMPPALPCLSSCHRLL